jgi:RHS repeat-associated protein
VTVDSTTAATVTTPGGAAGAVDVTARTPGGEATLSQAFRYYAPPTIAAFAPGSGFAGTTVTIFGTNFDTDAAGNTVRFGALPAEVLSATATEIRTRVPHGAASGTIAVTTAGGTVESPQPFIVPVLMTIAITPASAAIEPGQTTQFTARGTYSDATTVDLTSLAAWTTANPSVATVNNFGLARAIGAGTTTISATMSGVTGTASLHVRTLEPLPPDPSTVAPRLDPTVVSTLLDEISFLYSGPSPIQTGVAPGTITEQRATLFRGRLLNRQNAPFPGVKVTILGHPEYGQTLSRADGWYDLVVNGGGPLVVRYERSGHAEAQRLVRSLWGDQKVIDDVVLVQHDAAVTSVAFPSSNAQVARGSAASDDDGARRATLIVPANTTASLVFPDGHTQSASTLNIRATEYSIGASGKAAMPAELPASSAYTYCVELSADEAATAGASEVRFSQPVAFYVENFLGFPIGTVVPVGYYDRVKGAWKSSPDGRVVKVLSVAGGIAQLDSDGNNAADNVLGLGTAELQKLATLYTAGQTLWRATTAHFTPFDLNWPSGTPGDAVVPEAKAFWIAAPSSRSACGESGNSIVDCANQTLSESIGISGTPFSLEYNSARSAAGRRQAIVQLSDATVPASVRRIEMTVSIAGETTSFSFAPQANLQQSFTWDGRDAYGRAVSGARYATINVAYVYQPTYTKATASLSIPAWGQPGTMPLVAAREEVRLFHTLRLPLGSISSEAGAFGGWSLDAQRFYDGRGQTLDMGSAAPRSADPNRNGETSVTTVAGSGACCFAGDGGPARAAQLNFPVSAAAAPDGSLYIAEFNRIRKVDPQGTITTIAGNGQRGFTADGLPAIENRIDVWDIAVATDGSLFVNDQGNRLVRRIANGIITTIASITADGIAAGMDGALLIAEHSPGRVLRIGADGVMTTLAGASTGGIEPADGVRATTAALRPVALAEGPDGSVYFTDAFANCVFRVGPDGFLRRVAGMTGGGDPLRDGMVATAGTLNRPWGVAVSGDGTVLITELQGRRVIAVSPNGIATTFAGNGERSFVRGPEGEFARNLSFPTPHDVDVAPDGSVLVVENGLNIIRRAGSRFPAATRSTAILMPSGDGQVVYVFESGRHTRTVDALTGVTLLTLRYDGAGQLIELADLDGETTRIERSGSGVPLAIVAPGGQRTSLTISGGKLTAIDEPGGITHGFGYDGAGMLSRWNDPRGGIHEYVYDAQGLLVRDAGPDGGFIALARSGTGPSYTVERESAEGRRQRYEVVNGDDLVERRTTIGRDGLATLKVFGSGTMSSTSPDGTIVRSSERADPRFGSLASLGSSSMTTPSGLTGSASHTRALTLSDPANPLSVVAMTDTTTINGKAFTTTYDAATRTATSRSPLGRTATMTLDAKGRTVATQMPGLAPGSFTYDPNGLPASITIGTRTTNFAYNARRELTGITDALSRTVQFAYDDAGRVTTQTLPDGRTIKFSYDAAGNVTSVTPPGRSAHAFTFTPVNLTGTYTAPGATTKYAYDKDRQLTLVTRPDASTVTPSYDDAGRLATLAAPHGLYRYAHAPATGRLASITAPDGGTLTYAHDGPLVTSVTWAGAVSGSVAYTYDNNFRVTSENGAAYGYDDDGLLIRAGDLTLRRDSQNGLLNGTTLGAVTDSYTDNPHGEMTRYAASLGTETLLAIDYTRDAGGRITAKTETTGTTMAPPEAYEYDLAGRLMGVTRNGSALAEYDYDANSNRTAHRFLGGTATATYDEQDRLLTHGDFSYTYTANGDLRSRTLGGQTTSFDYDAMGNLRRVVMPGKTIEYVIDGQNRRVGKKVDGVLVQGWLYADQLRIVAELDGSGAVTSRFVYGSRSNVPDYMVRAGATYRIISDHLGSPRVVVRVADGTIAQRMTFDESGRVLQDTTPGFQPFGFAGGLSDRDTGLVRFGARDYDSHTGRWTATDAVRFAGGQANLYGYSFGDPVNYVDPNGLSGKLTINSSGANGSSDTMLAGHSWIAYTPDGGDKTTFGTYGNNPNGGPNGLHEGLELKRPEKYARADASRTTWISDEQEALLFKLIGDYRAMGEQGWTSGRTCSTFSSDAWYAATGERLSAVDDWYPNPTVLRESIKQQNNGLGARVLRFPPKP